MSESKRAANICPGSPQASDRLPEEVLLLRPRRGDQPHAEGGQGAEGAGDGGRRPAGGRVTNVAPEPGAGVSHLHVSDTRSDQSFYFYLFFSCFRAT